MGRYLPILPFSSTIISSTAFPLASGKIAQARCPFELSTRTDLIFSYLAPSCLAKVSCRYFVCVCFILSGWGMGFIMYLQ